MRRFLVVFLLLCSVAFAENPYRSYANFNAGELYLLEGREDLAKYQSGCSIMENVIPIPQGGAQKRPGTKYIAEVKTSSLKTRILPFEFSTSQSYIIEAGNQYFRFFTNGVVINQGVGLEDLSALDNVIAQWKLNDDAANTAVDDNVASVPHDGVASSNTEDLSETGIINNALNFKGTDWAVVPHNAELSFGDGSVDSPFSLAAWIFVVSGGSETTIIAKQKTGTGAEWNLLTNSDNKLSSKLFDGAESAIIVTDNPLSEAWHFVVMTYAGQSTSGSTAANFMKLYIDGILVTDVTRTTTGSYDAMSVQAGVDVYIGAKEQAVTFDSIWLDRLDNIFITSDVLTADEISVLYLGGVTTTPLEVVTPYLTADLFDLKFEQSADVLYIVHPSYETRKLSRTANTAWMLETIGITAGPFRTQNSDVTKTIAASGASLIKGATVTLTASGHNPFIADTTIGHIPNGSAATDKAQTGALFKIVHPATNLESTDTLEKTYVAADAEGTSWMSCGTLFEGAGWTITTGGTWLGTIEIQRNYTIGAGQDAAGWETVLPFTGVTTARNLTTTGNEDDGDADYRVRFLAFTSGSLIVYFTTDQTEIEGIVEIVTVTSATVATGTVRKSIGGATTDATHKWAEGAWSNYRGWPQTVTFFEDRLMFGGNTAQPDTIWGSVTSDYENMKAGVDDDEAVIFTLSSRQVNVIEWLIGKDKLLIGTSGAEWSIAGGTDEPLTPSNVIAKQHSTYGSANLQATLANESVLFFQRGKEKMRELAYNWELDSYVAPDMTILANLVTTGGINDTSLQKIPDSILWTVRADGEMPIFSYERQENITAWSRMVTTDGTSDSDFESVAVINGNPEDEVWVVVERTIDSNTVRYIEQFQPRIFGDPCDAYYVDAGITYDSTATTTITGLSHLEGETVAVLGDGIMQASKVVSGGQITIDSALTVQVGLPYEVHLRTMPLSWLGGQTIQGRQKRISEVVSRWYKSGDFSIGKDVDNQQTYSITGQTTDIDRKTFSPGWDRNAYIYIYQKSPEPLTVLSVMMEFKVQ